MRSHPVATGLLILSYIIVAKYGLDALLGAFPDHPWIVAGKTAI